ncbi:MAG TPA: DUF4332 domain-containing protein [Candidatus Thermoplasmatota archaeon]|nr:DUF4332 domain-containing protein [Candidatus Thermoplasmatota archaeon]
MAFGRKRKEREAREAAERAAAEAAARQPPPVEVVPGGPLRRIVFEGPSHGTGNTPPEAAANPAASASPPPAPAAGRPLDLVRGDTTRRVDWPESRLGGSPATRTYTSYASGSSAGRSWEERRVETRTLYETPRGAVREARMGDQRAIYISRRDGPVETDTRFLHSMVDRVIANVRLEEEVVEEVEEPVSASRPGPTGPGGMGGLGGGAGEPVAEYRRVVPADPAPRQEPSHTGTGVADASGDEPWSPDRPRAAGVASVELFESDRASRVSTLVEHGPDGQDAPRDVLAADLHSPQVYFDYPGDNHLVIDVEGIGKAYAKRLQKAGVHTTARLCYEDAARLSQRIDVPEATVRLWQSMAELMKVKGVGAQYAEAMARAGVSGIAELRRLSPEALSEKVTSHLATVGVTVIGHGLTPARARSIVEAAKAMRKVRQDVPPTGAPETVTTGGGRQLVAATRSSASAAREARAAAKAAAKEAKAERKRARTAKRVAAGASRAAGSRRGAAA